MESSYQEIIRECKGSIQGAQMAFYDLFAPILFASAYRLLNNEWEDWDDNLVTQTEESTETVMIRQEHMAQLHTAIAMMSERDRTVLLLSLVEELTTEEMSKVLGIKPSSVRSQLSRAKQRLIKLFQR